jgi:hypothetical protein
VQGTANAFYNQNAINQLLNGGSTVQYGNNTIYGDGPVGGGGGT